MASDLTYTFSVGNEQFARKACYLAQSIRTYATDPHIVSFVATQERDDIPAEHLRFLEEQTTLVEGERPIEGYPISDKLAAFKRGTELSERPYVVHLDSDTLLMNDVDAHRGASGDRAEVYLKPVDFAGYWGSARSFSDWESLYRLVEADFPGVAIRSTMDNREIPPYYNAGVVVAENGSFAADWIETTRRVHDSIVELHGEEWAKRKYADQIALGLLSHEFELGRLDDDDSRVLSLSLLVPDDVNVLRYQEFDRLHRITNTTLIEKFSETGVKREMGRDPLELYLKLMRKRKKYGHFLRSILPW